MEDQEHEPLSEETLRAMQDAIDEANEFFKSDDYVPYPVRARRSRAEKQRRRRRRRRRRRPPRE